MLHKGFSCVLCIKGMYYTQENQVYFLLISLFGTVGCVSQEAMARIFRTFAVESLHSLGDNDYEGCPDQ